MAPARLLFACIFLASVANVSTQQAPTKDTQPADLKSSNMDVTFAVKEGIKEWTDTRQCSLPAEANFLVVDDFTSHAEVFENRAAKSKLTPTESHAFVRAMTMAYLDDLRDTTKLGACSVKVPETGYTLFMIYAKKIPDTGVLEVDGSQRGAEIFIDGAKKGAIKQAFVPRAGRHIWKTMKCEEEIAISANDNKKVYCPKQ